MASQTMLAGMKFSITGTPNSHGITIFYSPCFSLGKMNVDAFKIASTECTNYPLVKQIAKMEKPVLLSSSMNTNEDISPVVRMLQDHNAQYAILHCVPNNCTPDEKVRITLRKELRCSTRGGSLPDIMNYLPDGGQFP